MRFIYIQKSEVSFIHLFTGLFHKDLSSFIKMIALTHCTKTHIHHIFILVNIMALILSIDTKISSVNKHILSQTITSLDEEKIDFIKIAPT